MQLCRIFLCRATEQKTKYIPMSWNTLCLPKLEGGMNIRDSNNWNVAKHRKYIWNNAWKDYVRIKWIDHYYLEGTSIWKHMVRENDSWHCMKHSQVRGQLLFGFEQHYNIWKQTKNGVYVWKMFMNKKLLMRLFDINFSRKKN